MLHLLLDFDGTLADTSSGIYSSFSHACSILDLTPPSLTTFRGFIGPPVEQIVQHIYPTLSPNLINDFKMYFRDNYDTINYKKLEWYKGTRQTLFDLRNNLNIDMSLVTNKPTIPAKLLLDQLDLTRNFTYIVGIDYPHVTANNIKFLNKSESLLFILTKIKTKKSHIFYVGDTLSDYRASNQVGIGFVAATYGFHQWSQGELDDTITISSIECLYSTVVSLLSSI